MSWELWEGKGKGHVGEIFVSVTPLGKGRLSRAVVKTLVPLRSNRDRRLQLLVDRKRGAFAFQSTPPENLDSFEWTSETYVDLGDLFNSLGFALPPKTKRIHGKFGTDPDTGNKIVEFLLPNSFEKTRARPTLDRNGERTGERTGRKQCGS